jgi:hypothetical protein
MPGDNTKYANAKLLLPNGTIPMIALFLPSPASAAQSMSNATRATFSLLPTHPLRNVRSSGVDHVRSQIPCPHHNHSARRTRRR